MSRVITVNDLKAIIDSILPDRIIEEGTSGIWTYRKWKSGIAECWGKASATSAFAVWSAPVYYATTYLARQNFPSGLFSETPCLNVTIAASSGSDGWLGNDSTNVTNAASTGRFYMLRIGAVSGTPTYTAHYHAIGKWN